MNDSVSVVLTAGYAWSPQASALLQLLRRDGVRVAGIVVVSPYSLQRVGRLFRRQGLAALVRAGRRSIGWKAVRAPSQPDVVETYFRSEYLDQGSLHHLARKFKIPIRTVISLNERRATEFVGALHSDGVLYCGGGILRDAFLAAASKVLNAHAGPLPRVRGMNAVEWSVLFRLPLQVSIHFIDVGIDTGAKIDTVPIELDPGDTVEALRSKSLIAAVVGLRRNVRALLAPIPLQSEPATAHRQLFTLAPALRELLNHRLGHSSNVRI